MKINKLTPGSNLMWESSRLIIPEHREQILRHQKESNKKQKPILDEHKLEELARLLSEAFENDQEVIITVFNEYKDTVITGKINIIDMYLERIKFLTVNDYMWIELCNILNIEINN